MWRLLVVLVVAKFLVTVDEDLRSERFGQGILPILDVLQSGMNIIKPRLFLSYVDYKQCNCLTIGPFIYMLKKYLLPTSHTITKGIYRS